jgi:hypothetical protein
MRSHPLGFKRPTYLAMGVLSQQVLADVEDRLRILLGL